MFKIKDVSNKCPQATELAGQFLPFAQKRMGFNKPVDINFISDPDNAKNPLGKTAYYDPNMMKVVVFVDKRHVKDILRSLSHELVHHAQHCRGEFDKEHDTGPGYAQRNQHMRKMEGEAYLVGNLCFRDWEDGQKNALIAKINLKENKKMSKVDDKIVEELTKRIFMALQEKKGKQPPQLAQAQAGQSTKKKGSEEEAKGTLGDGETQGTDSVEAGLDNNPEFTGQDFAAEKGGKRGKKKEKVAEMKDVDEINPDSMEETLDEEKKEGEEEKEGVKGQYKGKDPEMKKENWFKGNKDQLLFERLVKKWAK